MDSMNYWRLCDELTVIHAALLIADCDPSSKYVYVEKWEIHDRPEGYEAAKNALMNAIRSGRLKATIRHDYYEADDINCHPEYHEGLIVHEGDEYIYSKEPNWYKTTIYVEDLKQYLASRGFKHGFFFPIGEGTPDYLNPTSDCYSPKLAAALESWQAVSSDQSLSAGTTVKQALMKWLRMNATRFDLIKDDGHPSDGVIEEIAKISNWNQKGGAPKTPDANEKTAKQKKPIPENFNPAPPKPMIDDDIPF